MSGESGAERFTTRWHRSTYLLGYLLILGVGVRRFSALDSAAGIGLALAFLVVFTALYATERRLARRFRRYPRIYFIIQSAIVQAFGFFEIYMDTWAMLYVVLGLQAAAQLGKKEATVWWGLFAASIMGSLCFEFGILSGLGRGLAYVVIGVLLVSFDSLYAQREDAQAESLVLLDELKAAHIRLREQEDRQERLAALQQRSRMIGEMYDAVGQKVFAIQLMAETASAVLEKDRPQAYRQLDLLQVQTQEALGQMRHLIDRWRTGV